MLMAYQSAHSLQPGNKVFGTLKRSNLPANFRSVQLAYGTLNAHRTELSCSLRSQSRFSHELSLSL